MIFRMTGVAALSVLCCIAIGCGGGGDRPPLGEVTGVVTLDGEPLPGATLVFRPLSQGRQATGVTNDEGEYRLMYRRYPDEIYGCKVGENQVIISTFLPEDEPGGPAEELVPQCYRGRESSVTASVAEGDNQLDFSLTSDCAGVK